MMKWEMKVARWFYSALIMFFSGCMPAPSLENLPNIQLRVSCCPIGNNNMDIVHQENELGSIAVNIEFESLIKFESNSIFIISQKYFEQAKLFQRNSQLQCFSEYVYYYFDNYSSKAYFSGDSLTVDAPIEGAFIELNCGTEPFGYDTTVANIEFYWEGRYTGLTPVRDVPLDSFKRGYYSVVKWLYAQETDRYKVKRKKYEQFDHDYGPTASAITSKNLVLEDPWQKEFLFTTYELIDTRPGADKGYPILTVEPYTLAPIHLYEMRPLKSEREKSVYKPDKYHINVADMAIRVYRYPTYKEMQKH